MLNDLVEWFNDTMKAGFTEEKLKEFLGHTKLQVYVGVTLGVVNAIALHFIFFAA
jgi:acid phosphatase family membrane protein YuiD